MNAINSNEQMIQKINEVLQNKKDAIVNIVNDKLTISVFSLLEKNLQNVKEINFVIRDVKFLPHQSEMAHEFEINPTDILFNAYDITEKNKLQHFSKARSMHDFIEKHVNIRKVNAGIHIGGNILIIDDDFMIQGSSSLEVSKKSSRDAFSNINFDTILNGSADKEQILGALETFKKIWFNEQISVDYKDIVYELMLRQNSVPLSSKIEQIFGGGGYKRTYLYADSYLVCLETKVTNELIDKLAELDPLPIKFIFRDSAFRDDIALKDETFRRLKALIEKNHGMHKMTYTVEFL